MNIKGMLMMTRSRWLLIRLMISVLAVVLLTTVARADDWANIRNQAAIATAFNFSPLPNNAGQGITIAVLTTGITTSLQGRLGSRVRVENFVPTESATDLHGFGTHLVSILAALAPKSRIISLKVLFKNGKTKFALVAKGISRAVSLGAKILVIPLGSRPTATPSSVTKAVISALDKGMLVVAAAGNAGKPQVYYPANVNGVIAVGANDARDNATYFSNYGGKIVYAPGNKIVGLFRGGNLRPLSGTTSSATVAAAIYAVLWSQRPHASAKQIADLVTRTARRISVKGESAKRIDGTAALKARLR